MAQSRIRDNARSTAPKNTSDKPHLWEQSGLLRRTAGDKTNATKAACDKGCWRSCRLPTSGDKSQRLSLLLNRAGRPAWICQIGALRRLNLPRHRSCQPLKRTAYIARKQIGRWDWSPGKYSRFLLKRVVTRSALGGHFHRIYPGCSHFHHCSGTEPCDRLLFLGGFFALFLPPPFFCESNVCSTFSASFTFPSFAFWRYLLN